MNIWVIGRDYPQPSNQMRGSFELEQAKMLATSGNKITYISACLRPSCVGKSKMKNWIEDNLEIFTYSLFFPPRIYPLYAGKLRDKIWMKYLLKIEKKIGKPDIIHLHYPVMSLLANVMETYQQKGIKIVVTEHWSKVLAKKLDAYELKQQKRYVDFVDTYICVGKPLKEAVLELTHSNRSIKIVPNIVNKAFVPSDVKHSGFNFISVGRLTPVKQFGEIIKAFSDLFKGNTNVRLYIVGNGSEYDNLKQLVDDLGICEQITLTGSLDRKATAQKVSQSDCLVCYSRFETFGVPVIEAWACGIPVISTTAVSVTDNFDSKLGIEISPNNFEALKKSMAQIYNNVTDYQKNYITNYAVQHFSENTVLELLMEIYCSSSEATKED